MIINSQQAIQTLDILRARHRKIINGYGEKYLPSNPNSDETIKVTASLKSLDLYNSFKKNYQPSV